MKPRVLFAVVCLAAAGLNAVYQLQPLTVGLIIAATLPWSLPALAPLLKTFKFAGLELELREVQKQIEAQQIAITGGIGGAAEQTATVSLATRTVAAGAGLSMSTPAAAEDDDDDHPYVRNLSPVVVDMSDPNKGRFGSVNERNGYRLDASVEPFPGSSDLFLVHARVYALDSAKPLRAGLTVVFYLHPTFSPSQVSVLSANGEAKLDRAARGAFTMGAEVAGTRLELDLATEIPGAPALFRSR